MGHEVKVPLLENFYADYYTMASIALASCLAMCVVVRFLGRRGGLLLFMILTALASLLQLGLLNREWSWGVGWPWSGAGWRDWCMKVLVGLETSFSDLVSESHPLLTAVHGDCLFLLPPQPWAPTQNHPDCTCMAAASLAVRLSL